MLFALRNMGGFFAARLNVRNERGATMVEYGLMIAFVALVVGLAALTLGDKVSALFDDAGTAVDSAPVPTYTP
jgi:pilus assembly protein Flp/PilA